MILLVTICAGSVMANGNEARSEVKNPLKVSVKFLSKHLWRGRPSGNTGSVEPDITWEINKNWSLSMWGGYCFDGSYQELDLYVTYKWKQFSFSLFDYYNPPSDSTFFSSQISTFDNDKTLHLFDLKAGYQFKRIPLSFTASTLIYGDDKTAGRNQRFSTYFEAVYTYKRSWGELSFLAGGTPHKSLYASKAKIVNLETSTTIPVKISRELKTNVSGSIIYNPIRKESYFRAGLQVQL
jgi:hypothetical protein